LHRPIVVVVRTSPHGTTHFLLLFPLSIDFFPVSAKGITSAGLYCLIAL